MAINISTDINVTTGGKLTDVGQIQGAWRTVDNESDMYALTASSTTQQKLQNGMMFYVSASNSLYTLDIAGSFPFVTYNFNSFSWPGSGGGGATDISALNTFTGSIQTQVDALEAATSSYLTSASAASLGFGSGGSTDISALNTFTGSIQGEVNVLKSVTGSYATTGSNTFVGDQTINGILTLTTQSTEPTYVSGGLYLDTNYNLFLGSI